MRKLKTFIYFFITFIFLSSPIDAKASSVALTTESINLLNSGIDFLSYSGSVPYGFLPFVFSSDKTYQDVLENMMQKQDVFIVDGNANIQIRELTQNEYGLLENAYVYDVNGDAVSLSDLYFGTVDNGYFTEKFYCKNDGSIVYQDASKESPYLDVKFGGSELSYVGWENAYNSLSSDLATSQLNYSLSGTDLSNANLCLYYMLGRKYRDSVGIATVFIPNAYTSNVLATNTGTIYSNGTRSWLTMSGNDTSLRPYNDYWGSYTQYGHSYELRTDMQTNFNNATVTDYYTMTHGNVGNSWVYYLVDYNGWTFDSSIASSLQNDTIVSYKTIYNTGDTLDLSKAYSYESISDYADTVSGLSSVRNPDFDKTEDISDINYPFVITNVNAVDDVVLPFPDSIVIDDTPAIEYPIEDTIDPSLISNNIPIVQGLQNKFPFSIPWDIYNLVNGLSVTRETPSIQHTIEIPIINYEWEIDLDLSMYNDSAELFRRLFLILFIIGLAVFSYQHFFGS